MRLLIRAALAVAVLLAAAAAGLALALPRVVRSDAIHRRIETVAGGVLDRELRYGDLEVGLFPPSLVLRDAKLVGETPGEAPPLRAREVALRVALAPLVARTLVIDSLVLEGAAVRLLRTRDGLRLAVAARAAEDGQGRPVPTGGGSPGVAIRALDLRDSSILLEDRLISPPVTWELRDVEARARDEALDGSLDLEASAKLARGGRLRARGAVTLWGEVAVTIELEGFDLAALRPYFGADAELAGTVTGVISARGPVRDPDLVTLDLELREARLRLGEVALRGPATVWAEIVGGLQRPRGRFEADATRAELRFGGVYRKPAGVPKRVTGRIVSEPGGELGVEDVELRIGDAAARGPRAAGAAARATLPASGGSARPADRPKVGLFPIKSDLRSGR